MFPGRFAGRTTTSKEGNAMQSTLWWLAFGDIHDNVSRLEELPGLADATGVIVTGDITVGGGIKQAERSLEAVARVNPNVLAQIGNMDRGEVTEWLETRGWNLHASVREVAPGAAIVGVGASTFTSFGTPSEFPESRFSAWLDDIHRTLRERGLRRVLLVSHNPPHHTLCDRVGDRHVGSTAVREFIEEVQPDVCVCGHIHESRGVDRIGRTVVVNPGTLLSGGYVVVRLAGEGGFAAELNVLKP